ncbi:Hpt domain-containing protein [Rickettsiales bacterium]|nr:Hpt domain-containing protein [Rickettsiales bacterium]
MPGEGNINWDTIEGAKSLMGDKFTIMIEYFLEDTATYIDAINNGLNSNDIEQVKVSAHTIKSSALQIGADKVSEIAKDMEVISIAILENSDSDLSKLNSLCENLKDAFSKAEPELKKLL